MGKTPNKPKPTVNGSNDIIPQIFEGFAMIIHKYGKSTALLAAFLIVLFKFTSDEQKQSVVDTWILMKPENDGPMVITIITLVYLMVFQFITYLAIIKYLKLERNRLKNELTQYKKPLKD